MVLCGDGVMLMQITVYRLYIVEGSNRSQHERFAFGSRLFFFIHPVEPAKPIHLNLLSTNFSSREYVDMDTSMKGSEISVSKASLNTALSAKDCGEMTIDMSTRPLDGGRCQRIGAVVPSTRRNLRKGLLSAAESGLECPNCHAIFCLCQIPCDHE
jgi:hypothetical protein